MKAKITAKAIRNSGDYLVSAGYCELAALFNYRQPDYYTCGIYGWNFDAYCLYDKKNNRNVIISTGYRNMPGIDAKNAREYNAKAEKIIRDYSISHTEQREKLDKLITEFIEQL